VRYASIAVILAVVTQARADFITYTSPGLSGTLPLFDPALGTLESAKFSDSFVAAQSFTVTNPTDQPLGLTDSYYLHYSVSTGTPSSYYPPGVDGVWWLSDHITALPGQTVTSTSFAQRFSVTNYGYGGSPMWPLAEFIGAGQSLYYGTTFGGPGDALNVDKGLIVDGRSVGMLPGGGFSVTYTYEPAAVPEPSAIVLVATGLAVALVYRWRTQ
jgi:hypothetical protein